jgi:FHS family L-fucose permease-like MFS transporter
MNSSKNKITMNKIKVVDKRHLLPFIVITSLFALWGFANDITNPMVAAFKTVMEISNAKASLVQFAFYGGYATMAIPAALFVQKYSYKKGILLGLALYSIGALLFWPAAQYQVFGFFLVSLYILTFGLAFLETTANPFILSLGAEETATRRLNLAQAFNPMGSLLGMFVASRIVLAALESDKRNATGELIFPMLDEATKAAIRANDLMIIRNPYVILGLVVIVMFVVILFTKMPQTGHANEIHPLQSLRRLINNKVYREGVVAQVFYVDASKLKGEALKSWWYSPLEGKTYSEKGQPMDKPVIKQKNNKMNIVSPDFEGSKDWVLVLDVEESDYPSPGISLYE